MHVKGAVAVITGGARGFGRAFSEALLRRGCKVCFGDVNVPEGKNTERTLNKTYGPDVALFVKCDVTDDKDFKELFRAAKAKFKNIDLVVNNAGILDEELWEKTIDINLTGSIRGTRLAVEHMRKDKGGSGGVVINVASSGGIYPAFFLPTYIASKFGIVGLTRSWADNPLNKSMGLSFACLCPAFSDTAMMASMESPNPPVLFWEETKEVVMQAVDKIGINSVEAVTNTFLELVEKDNCNGDVVTVDKLHGTKYHYTVKKNKL